MWPRALSYGRASGTCLALALFVLTLTLDDLHLFRVPTLYVGLGVSVAAFAFAPPWFASNLIDRLAADRHPDPATAIETALVRRRFLWGVTIAALIVWLFLFASGRTPRW